MQITFLHPKANIEHLGYIPMWLHEDDERSAIQQLNDGYSFAGGWQKFDGFSLNKDTLELKYPGDPPMKPIASISCKGETVYMYQYGWVMVLKKDNTFEVCRMD